MFSCLTSARYSETHCIFCTLHYTAFISTDVFGSTGFGNNGFSGITDILAIPKLKFCIKNTQNNGFSGITDKMAIPKWSGTSENLCIAAFISAFRNFSGIHVCARWWCRTNTEPWQLCDSFSATERTRPSFERFRCEPFRPWNLRSRAPQTRGISRTKAIKRNFSPQEWRRIEWIPKCGSNLPPDLVI